MVNAVGNLKNQVKFSLGNELVVGMEGELVLEEGEEFMEFVVGGGDELEMGVVGEEKALFFVSEGGDFPLEMVDERGLVVMRILELSELEMIGNQIFLESVVLESDSFGLGFEVLV